MLISDWSSNVCSSDLMACHDKAGSQSHMARDLNCSQAAVWKMIQSSKRISHQYVLAAERLYGVAKEDLRPDLYQRPIMVDQGTEDRFCGIDLRARDRREAERRKEIGRAHV